MIIVVGSWPQTGRCGARASAENSHLYLKGGGKAKLEVVWAFETSEPTASDKPPPTRPQLLQQGHIYFNKATTTSLPQTVLSLVTMNSNIWKLWEPLSIKAPQSYKKLKHLAMEIHLCRDGFRIKLSKGKKIRDLRNTSEGWGGEMAQRDRSSCPGLVTQGPSPGPTETKS